MSSLSSLCDPGLTTWLLFDGYELFLSEIEEFVGKETAIVNELLIRKGFQKLRFEKRYRVINFCSCRSSLFFEIHNLQNVSSFGGAFDNYTGLM